MKITLEHLADSELEVVIKGDTMSDEVKNILNILSNSTLKKSPKMIIGKREEKEFVLPILKIESFYTSQNSLFAFYSGDEYKVKAKLFEIEESYSKYGFKKISKSTLINCKFLSYLQVEFSGNYIATTQSKKTYTISRKYISEVKRYIKEDM